MGTRIFLFIVFMLSNSWNFGSFEDYLNIASNASESNLEKFTQRYGLSRVDEELFEPCLQHKKCYELLKSALQEERCPGACSLENLYKSFELSGNDGVLSSELGDYLKSYDVFRVINAARLKNCIVKNHLNKLDVAFKKIGNIQGTDFKIVLSKNIVGEFVNSISLLEIQQLTQLVKLTGYTDFGGGRNGQSLCNLIRSQKTGKLVFIDTENISFGGEYPQIRWQDFIIHPCSPLACVHRMYHHVNQFLEPEAREWIENEIVRMRACNEGIECQISLPNNSKYDDADINFRQIVQELVRLKTINIQSEFLE